jgi:RNA polymerase sigma-70 factor, ECF subfamily
MGTVDEFDRHRGLLFGVAYRMLGSSADAEDVLQEARVRWQGEAAQVDHPHAFLVTVVSRLCLDQLKSARVRREAYVGPWLPEPVFTPPDVDTAHISTAFLLLLERLEPAERAAFLLREVFDYSHAEVAAIIGKSEEACRQLAHRAKQHMVDGRPRAPADRDQHRRMLEAFATACTSGDLAALERLLADDAVMHSDGGGRVSAARKLVSGRNDVARFILGVMRFYAGAALSFELREINGLPALVIGSAGKVINVLSVSVDGDQVHAIYSVLNPDKLAHLTALPTPVQ